MVYSALIIMFYYLNRLEGFAPNNKKTLTKSGSPGNGSSYYFPSSPSSTTYVPDDISSNGNNVVLSIEQLAPRLPELIRKQGLIWSFHHQYPHAWVDYSLLPSSIRKHLPDSVTKQSSGTVGRGGSDGCCVIS